MIVTKKALPRRTFLRGAGAALALPLLDAMVPALTAQAATPAAPVRRLGFVFIPMGCDITRWTPNRICDIIWIMRHQKEYATSFQNMAYIPQYVEMMSYIPFDVA